MEHPREEQLIVWVDESQDHDGQITLHLGECAACRDRVEELRRLYDHIGSDPDWPSASVFEGQRAKITERISTPVVASIEPSRSSRWIPLAAAAVVTALIVFGVTMQAPSTVGPSVGLDPGGNGLAVVAAADQAAAEVIQVASWVDELDSSVATSSPEWTLLEEEFEALTVEERSAILDELEGMRFDL